MVAMTIDERKKLRTALVENAENNCSIIMNEKDTSFVGTADEEVVDAQVISAIRSIPCHY